MIMARLFSLSDDIYGSLLTLGKFSCRWHEVVFVCETNNLVIYEVRRLRLRIFLVHRGRRRQSICSEDVRGVIALSFLGLDKVLFNDDLVQGGWDLWLNDLSLGRSWCHIGRLYFSGFGFISRGDGSLASRRSDGLLLLNRSFLLPIDRFDLFLDRGHGHSDFLLTSAIDSVGLSHTWHGDSLARSLEQSRLLVALLTLRFLIGLVTDFLNRRLLLGLFALRLLLLRLDSGDSGTTLHDIDVFLA